MHAIKEKQGIHSLLPIGRQVFSYLQESKAPSCVMVTWEDKTQSLQMCAPLLSSRPSFICWAWCPMHMTSLWSAGIRCPSCVPFQHPVHPQPTCCWSGARSTKGLDSL